MRHRLEKAAGTDLARLSVRRYALLNDEVIENDDERQKLLDILISLDNG